jgi:hypothetical protein
MKYRKKPVVIEAIQNHGIWEPIVEWLQQISGSYFAFQPGTHPPITRNEDGSLNIHTLEGTMRADVGDVIICGIKGEFYPVKIEIFLATYEEVLK